MKKILTFLLALFLLACYSEPWNVRYGREGYMKYFEKHLNNPSSLVIYEEEYKIEDKNDNLSPVRWTIDYGAKNRYGGMDRRTITFRTLSAAVIEVNGEHIYK